MMGFKDNFTKLCLIVSVILILTSYSKSSLLMGRISEEVSRLINGNMTKMLHSNMRKNWAVLVAGSCGFNNYRHQADVAHAYQILKAHNFHGDRIILMMCDDVVNDINNPFPGKIFNNYSHIDVYEGIKIDYRFKNVSASNFLRIMKADQVLKSQGFKVLETDNDDHIFVFFTDHGSEGLVAFPEDELYAEDLKNLIYFMYKNKRFAQIVIYFEACESGSMFNFILPPKVYATSAANSKESSYACYCDDPELPTCLGDTYSVNWMRDAETHSLHKRTLRQQFEAVKRATNFSHVEKFGDMNLADEMLEEFEDGENTIEDKKHNSNFNPSGIIFFSPPDQISAQEAHLVPYKWILKHSNDINRKKEAELFIQLNKFYEHEIGSILNRIIKSSLNVISTSKKENNVLRQFLENNRFFKINQLIDECYKHLTQTFFKNCYKIQKYPMVAKHLYKLKNLCSIGYSYKTDWTTFTKYIKEFC